MRKRSAKGFRIKQDGEVFHLIDPRKRQVKTLDSKTQARDYSYILSRKKVPTDISLCGRDEQGYDWERRDCAVISYANFLNIDYDLSHKTYEAFGRIGKRATPSHISKDLLKAAGAKLVTDDKKLVLGDLPFLYPKGKYFIFIRGHITVMIDGQFVDSHLQHFYDKIREVYTI